MPSLRFLRALTLLLVASPVVALPLAAQQRPAARKAAPAKAVKGPTVEGITEYTLPNGLTFLLFPDESKATTTVNIVYFVGSRHENYGETGMAHLLEHLVFKGTPRHPNIPQELSQHGADPNGTTWTDRTNYYETFPASDANLTWALDLEADRMINSYIAQKDLVSEMTVVRNEFELGENDPGSILEERVTSTAFLWHNYGNSTIGARSDLENVPIERLQSFYHKHYQPDNALLVIAGRFDPATAVKLVEQKFGAIPRPKRTGDNVLWPTYTRDPEQDGERSVTLRRVGDVQMAMALYKVPPAGDPDYASVALLAEILRSAPSGRLYKALVAPGLAARVSASSYAFREPTTIVTRAEVRKDGSLADAERAMVATLDSLTLNPPTAEEVERARGTILKNVDLLLNQSDQVGLTLSDWAASGDWRLVFLFRDRVKAATAGDVARVARTYLKPDNRTVGRFIPTEKPDRAPLPPEPDFAAMVKDYRGQATVASGEAFDPTPAAVEPRITRGTLASGLKTVYLPKKTRGQSVNATLTLHYGNLEGVTGKSATADMTVDMLMRGTRNLSRQQIKDRLDSLKAKLSISGGPTQLNASIETTRPSLPAVLQLLGAVLREPAFDSKEFESLRQENLAALEQQRSDPIALGSQAYNRTTNPWPKGHPRYTPTFDESVADYTAVKLPDAQAFYAGFIGASSGEIAIVGDFDPAEVNGILAETLGSWKSPTPYVRVPQQVFDVKETNLTIETPDKANAFFISGKVLKLQDDDPDFAAMELANFIVGGGFLNSRLMTQIRQKEGLSYFVGSQFYASPLDQYGQFLGIAIYAPENAAKLQAAYSAVVDSVIRNGFTAEEVAQAKDGYLQSRQLSRSQDNELAPALAQDAFLGRTLAWDAALEAKVKTLTPAQLQAAFRKYVDPSAFVTVKAGDFAKGKPAAATP
jgi:zinc protease